jgi:hypothetical protein
MKVKNVCGSQLVFDGVKIKPGATGNVDPQQMYVKKMLNSGCIKEVKN